MEVFIPFIFLGITSLVFLLLSEFPYKLQSLMLGIAGAVGGGVFSVFLKAGLTPQLAQTILMLLLMEIIFLFALKRTIHLK